MFDLIIGTKTMNELGIILNFKHKMITIDEIELPMQSIHKLPTSKRKALALFDLSLEDNVQRWRKIASTLSGGGEKGCDDHCGFYFMRLRNILGVRPLGGTSCLQCPSSCVHCVCLQLQEIS